MKKLLLIIIGLGLFFSGAYYVNAFVKIDPSSSCKTKIRFTCGNSFSHNGQFYGTVEIGDQCWMSENLNVGTKITGISNQLDNSVIEKYCYDDNDVNCITHGGLYHWSEAMQYSLTEGARGICPEGWHIPTDAEQYTLENYLATGTCTSDEVGWNECDPAGAKLAGNATLWFDGDLDTNGNFGDSGFDALPAGYRTWDDGEFDYLTGNAYFWSSSESVGFGNGDDIGYAWARALNCTHTDIYRLDVYKASGYSVRCIKS